MKIPLLIPALATALLLTAHARAADFAFTHPGLLHSATDLARMKDAVAAHQEPILSGYQKLLQHPQSQLTYKMRGPLPAVGRNGGSEKSALYDTDATAAYQLSLLYAITGDHAYAALSRQIITAWSTTLKTIDGRDAVLMAGLGPFKMLNAAEILRSADPAWTPADTAATQTCFRSAVYPVLKDFALFANGNWDTAAMKTLLALAVFCDDRPLFDSTLRYYTSGPGDGSLSHYVINDQGQCQESGRDAGHWQLGIAHLGDCCQIAHNQGLDLFSLHNNRLLKAFEYAATYNLGGTVPFEPMIDRTGKYPWATIAPRGPLRPIYEQIYNHYVIDQATPSPILQKAVDSLRPEGPARPIADHTGFGTLLYAKPNPTAPTPRTPPSPPAALVATTTTTNTASLSWVPPTGALSYTVTLKAPNHPPATFRASEPSLKNAPVDPGTIYTYTVSATNAAGTSPDSLPLTLSSLPNPWQDADLGTPPLPGSTQFDGPTFTLTASGTGFLTSRDQGHFTAFPLTNDGTLQARFVPQMSAMRSQFGIMLRQSPAPDSPFVALLILPATPDAESPGYDAALLTRPTPAAVPTIIARYHLPSPLVTDGRLLQPLHLRLTRTADTFTAATSPDAAQWTPLATTTLPLPKTLLAGIPAASTILQKVANQQLPMTTTLHMDHVTLTNVAGTLRVPSP